MQKHAEEIKIPNLDFVHSEVLKEKQNKSVNNSDNNPNVKGKPKKDEKCNSRTHDFLN